MERLRLFRLFVKLFAGVQECKLLSGTLSSAIFLFTAAHSAIMQNMVFTGKNILLTK